VVAQPHVLSDSPRGAEYIPDKGGALLVPNHVSMVDAVLLIASAVGRSASHIQGVTPTIRSAAVRETPACDPISSQLRPREMIHALRTATQALKDGDSCASFPEGQITRIGQMLPSGAGWSASLKGTDVPVLPVYLGGVWGSIFRYDGAGFVWKWPGRDPISCGRHLGAPLPPTTTTVEPGRRFKNFGRRRGACGCPSSGRYTDRLSKRRAGIPGRLAMADDARAKPRLAQPSCAALPRPAAPVRVADQELVGILLPPSVPGGVGESRRTAPGKVPGQSKLHRLEGEPGILCPPVRFAGRW